MERTSVHLFNWELFLLYVAVQKRSDKVVQRETGLTPAQFNDLLSVLPTLQVSFGSSQKASDALYMYLMKMRNGWPDEDIGNIFNVSATTIGRKIKTVRSSLERDFVGSHINCIKTREELIEQSTDMCQALFSSKHSPKVVLICDGTYIFVNKSRNYAFQKKTYTDQKKRNFVRIMMCVTANGTIIYATGPYKASDNDAKVLREMDDSSDVFNMLGAGDVLILDRGFRDCKEYFEEKGIVVKMPSFLDRSKKNNQLSTIEANRTRLVTAVRFIVEVRNGHMKTVWKIFSMDWNPLWLPHLMIDFQICAALLNHYYVAIKSNKGIELDIAERMKSRLTVPNALAGVVLNIRFDRHLKEFEPFYSVDDLPTLTDQDLIWIALGKYQIKQAESYCSQHLKNCDGVFDLFALPDGLCQKFFPTFYSEPCKPTLLMTQLKSRHRSQKHYNSFVLVNTIGSGEDVVLGYCCECYNGLRTVGCCSHVMTLIWFALYKKNRDMPNPAGFLDKYFDIHFDGRENYDDMPLQD